MEKQVSEETVNWAYGVLTVLKEGMDKVAVKPEYMKYFFKEFMQNLPDVMEAFIILVSPEHRVVVADLLRSAVGVVRKIGS